MRKNKELALSLLGLACAMLLFAFASVPLYNLFCKVTGYAGSVKIADHQSTTKGRRAITVQFDANVDPNLQWLFKPEQREIKLITGENVLVFYTAENLTNRDLMGMAIYNVSPLQASQYFNKIECFCFEEQLLQAKAKRLMPVLFFIDPKFDDNPEMEDVDTITLSYSFYNITK